MWDWPMHSGWMALWWILVAAGVVWLVWFVVSRTRSGPGGQESAEELLRRRFAAGEIDEEDYRQRLAELRRTA